MRRIAVVGSGTGAGKTTFARRLGARLGIPVIEQDALFWGPNWAASDRADFKRRVLEALSGEAGVVDGNYGSIGGAQWQRADTRVWLDIPLFLTLWRVVRRTLRRIVTREELWPGTGNRETVRNAFFSRDSLLLYAVRTYGRRKRYFEELTRSGAWSHLTVHRFRSNADADRWVASIGNEERTAASSGPLHDTSGGAG